MGVYEERGCPCKGTHTHASTCKAADMMGVQLWPDPTGGQPAPSEESMLMGEGSSTPQDRLSKGPAAGSPRV